MPSASRHPHVTPALANSARERFQGRYDRALTDEDGREIATNLLGMIGVLREWRDQRSRPVPRSHAKRNSATGEPVTSPRSCKE